VAHVTVTRGEHPTSLCGRRAGCPRTEDLTSELARTSDRDGGVAQQAPCEDADRPDVAHPRHVSGRDPGGLADAGEHVLHVFLEANVDVLRARLDGRDGIPDDPEASQSRREWAFSRVDAAIAAAARQPAETLMLRSDRLTPVELADELLAAAGLRQLD
jgi:hypothetical protein